MIEPESLLLSSLESFASFAGIINQEIVSIDSENLEGNPNTITRSSSANINFSSSSERAGPWTMLEYDDCAEIFEGFIVDEGYYVFSPSLFVGQ